MEDATKLENKIKIDLQLSLFIGNGINQAIPGEGIGWGALLMNLQKSFDASHIDLKNKIKPFPLSFEEITYSASGDFDTNMREIKNSIAKAFEPSEPNLLHRRIMNSELVENIITTNYDYTFEKVLIKGFYNDTNRLPNSTTETKHSIIRRCFLNDYSDLPKSVWHIHGEINHNQRFRNNQYASESIQIGYDHYGEYLNEMQAYVKGRKYKNQPKMALKLEENIEGVSWIDKIFTDRVAILGLGLDFSEIDLWWLFNYRMKVFKRNPKLPINEIIYYQPVLAEKYERTPTDLSVLNDDELESFELNIFNSRIRMEKSKAKKDVLTSVGVKFEEVLCETYQEYYEKVFDIEKI